MARTLIVTQPVVRTSLRAGVAPVAADVANGNYVVNDGCTWLEVTNADAVNPHSFTVQLAAGLDGLTAGPRTITVPVAVLPGKTGIFPVLFYGPLLLINADSTQVRFNAYTVIGP